MTCVFSKHYISHTYYSSTNRIFPCSNFTSYTLLAKLSAYGLAVCWLQNWLDDYDWGRKML